MNNFLKSFRCLVSVVFLFAVAAYVTSVETSPTEAGQSPGFGSGDTVQTGPPQYQIIDIGVVQAGDTASQGFGASTGGVGVGRSFRTGGTQAFSWTQAGGIVGLPNLAGRAFAVANAANDSGRVVGTGATTAFGSGRLPIVWQNGVVSQLPLPAGETLGDANDVNSAGVAVGSVNAGSTQRAAVYTTVASTVITQTTAGGSFFNTAFGINESGRVVGTGLDPANAARNVGMVYDIGNANAIEVGALPGANGALAFGVSNSGFVTGSSMMNQGSGLPFIWSESGGIRAIPLPVGTTQGSGRAVNSAAWVVGNASSAFSIPFLTTTTTTYRLGDLIPPGTGWDLLTNTSSSALGISDNGVIVGTGVLNGVVRAYAMIPVPGAATPTPTATPTVTPTSTPTATPTPSPGGGFVVDRTDDNGAANACSAAANDCSLRGAVGNANASAANDVITFEPSVFARHASFLPPQTITLGGTEIVITNNGTLTINGPGASLLTVSGNNLSRIISNNAAVTTINGIRFTAGNGVGVANTGRAGAVYNNGGNLTLNNVVVTANTAANGGGLNNAGAGSVLTLTNSVISNNTATGAGGGMQNLATSTLNIESSEISGNTCASTITGGGAIQGNGTVNITNSTFANNIANGGSGGAIFFNGVQMAITNSTLAGNTSTNNGGGILKSTVNPLGVGNTIIANNVSTAQSSPDVNGAFISGGNNLIRDGAGATGFTAAGDQVGTTGNPLNPQLGPLVNNGGQSQTFALLAASTARNAGNNALAINLSGNPLTFDQRGVGFARIVSGTVDIGAFEAAAVGPTPTPTATPTSTPTATPTPGGATVQFSAASYVGDESLVADVPQYTVVTVTRTGVTTGVTTVNVTRTGGTANVAPACAAGVDAAFTSPTLITFPANDTTPKTFTIPNCPDTLYEADETILLSLTTPVGGGVGAQGTTTVIVNDTANQFRNTAPIDSILPGTQSAPSPITVTGGPTNVQRVRVTLFDLYHNFPDNIKVLLVNPQGRKYILMGDAGGAAPITQNGAVTLTFTDLAGQVLPDSTPLTRGKFEPTNWQTTIYDFLPPAPAGPYAQPGSTVGGTTAQTLFGNFGQLDGNGVWTLYIRDDNGDNRAEAPEVINGQVLGGWGLELLAATASGVEVSGRVLTPDGRGLRNATVSMVDSQGVVRTATTSSFGYYSFDSVEAGSSVVMNVQSRRYRFAPRIVQVIDTLTDVDFTGQE